MKKTYLGSAAIIALSASSAFAGGIERSVFSPAFLFESGNYADLSFGSVAPSVNGSFAISGAKSGDIAPSYSMLSGSVKMDMGDKWSLGLIIDQPVGASVDYSNAAPSYPYKNSTATVNSVADGAGPLQAGSRL